MTAELPLNPPQLLRNVLPEIADQLLLRLPELLHYAVEASMNYDLPYFLKQGGHIVTLNFFPEYHGDARRVITASTAYIPVPSLRLLSAFYRSRNADFTVDTSVHFLMRGELRCSAMNDDGEVYRASLFPHELPAALADALDALIEVQRVAQNNPNLNVLCILHPPQLCE